MHYYVILTQSLLFGLFSSEPFEDVEPGLLLPDSSSGASLGFSGSLRLRHLLAPHLHPALPRGRHLHLHPLINPQLCQDQEDLLPKLMKPKENWNETSEAANKV